jgi:hypothetical protein
LLNDHLQERDAAIASLGEDIRAASCNVECHRVIIREFNVDE